MVRMVICGLSIGSFVNECDGEICPVHGLPVRNLRMTAGNMCC